MASSIYCNSVSLRRLLKGSCSWKSWGRGLGVRKGMHPGFGEALVTDNTEGKQADPGTSRAGRSSLSPRIHQGLAFHHKAPLLRLRDKADQMLMLRVCVQCLRTFPIKGRQLSAQKIQLYLLGCSVSCKGGPLSRVQERESEERGGKIMQTEE